MTGNPLPQAQRLGFSVAKLAGLRGESTPGYKQHSHAWALNIQKNRISTQILRFNPFSITNNALNHALHQFYGSQTRYPLYPNLVITEEIQIF
jgi:hypothetical protein